MQTFLERKALERALLFALCFIPWSSVKERNLFAFLNLLSEEIFPSGFFTSYKFMFHIQRVQPNSSYELGESMILKQPKKAFWSIHGGEKKLLSKILTRNGEEKIYEGELWKVHMCPGSCGTTDTIPIYVIYIYVPFYVCVCVCVCWCVCVWVRVFCVCVRACVKCIHPRMWREPPVLFFKLMLPFCGALNILIFHRGRWTNSKSWLRSALSSFSSLFPTPTLSFPHPMTPPRRRSEWTRRRFLRRFRSDLTSYLLNLKNEIGSTQSEIKTGFSFW